MDCLIEHKNAIRPGAKKKKTEALSAFRNGIPGGTEADNELLQREWTKHLASKSDREDIRSEPGESEAEANPDRRASVTPTFSDASSTGSAYSRGQAKRRYDSAASGSVNLAQAIVQASHEESKVRREQFQLEADLRREEMAIQDKRHDNAQSNMINALRMFTDMQAKRDEERAKREEALERDRMQMHNQLAQQNMQMMQGLMELLAKK